MQHFLNGNMLIVVCRMARVWLKIQWFCNFCKFTNKNIRLLFKYQGLQVECSTLLQKIQLYLLHRTPIDLSTLVPWRSLAFFASDSILFSKLVHGIHKIDPKNWSQNSAQYVYIYQFRAKARQIPPWDQFYNLHKDHMEWGKL